MKIAVTGATGFVGREFLRQAAEEGHALVPLVRTKSGIPDEIVTGELSHGSLSAEHLSGVDAIVHLAARTHVLNDTADGEAEYHRVNVVGTNALLDAALEANVKRFVYMSSVKAIGEFSLPGKPLSPETPARPQDAYGRTKNTAEGHVRERCEGAGVEWVVLRPPLVFGPGVKANFARLVTAVAKGFPLPLGGVSNARSLVDVENLAQAALLACEIPQAAGRAFMVADTTVSTAGLLQAIGHAAGIRARLVSMPRVLLAALAKMAGRSAEFDRLCGDLELDAGDTRSILGWVPRRSFADGIAATVNAQLSASNGGQGAP